MYTPFDGRKKNRDTFESKIFPIKNEDTVFSNLATIDKVSGHSRLEVLTSKQNDSMIADCSCTSKSR